MQHVPYPCPRRSNRSEQAVTSTTRAASRPAVPTVNEFVPGFEVTIFVGLGVPRNTPDAIVEKLNSEFNASLAVPALKERVAELGDAESASSPGAFRKHVVEYADKWAKVIRAGRGRLMRVYWSVHLYELTFCTLRPGEQGGCAQAVRS
jgi:hypothetical protein